MTFDSSAPCARTPAGAAELAVPSKGLSLGQRRLLTLLENPAAADELAQKHHLEPEKLARDLTRLAELHLVQLPGAASNTPAVPEPVRGSTAPKRRSVAPVRGSMAPVVIGRSTLRSSVWPLAAGAAALLLAGGMWYGSRTRDAAPATPTPAIAEPRVKAEAPAPAPAPPAVSGTNAAIPAVATILRGNAAPAEVRPDIRPGLLPVASRAQPPEPRTKPAPEPLVTNTPPAGVTVPAAGLIATGSPAAMATTAVSAPVLPSPIATAVTAPATAVSTTASSSTASSSTASSSTASPPITSPTSSSNTATSSTASPAAASPITASPIAPANAAAEAPRPVQLAAAVPASTAARPAVTNELKAISREPPDFPREAAADGIKSGVVSARLHVDARGNVTRVDILGAQPPKVFDRAVRKALLHWRFEPIASGTATDLEVEVKFQRD